MDGGAGEDTVSYAGSLAGVTITFSEVTRRVNEEPVTTYEGAGSGGDAAGDRLINVERVVGSDHNDRLNGGKGNDHLSGGKGNDHLSGGKGNDKLYGGKGNDQLDGGKGYDNLYGGPGADVLDGGAGEDTVFYTGSSAGVTITFSEVTRRVNEDLVTTTYEGAGLGGDAAGDRLINVEGVVGSDHNDRLNGGKGNDKLWGVKGNDRLSGGDGDDTLDGGEGDDQLYGGDDNDILYGTDGDDTLYGGEGNDVLYGYGGWTPFTGEDDDDTLYGGAGDDYLIGDDGDDTLYGGDDNDTLDGGDDNDTLDGGDGNDKLYGGWGKDRLDGGEGNDKLYGRGGNDQLDGGDGNDYLEGGVGSDTLDGGKGNDELRGGHVRGYPWDLSASDDGSNTLRGGEGNDKLYGGRWHDKLYGGDGNDTLSGFSGDDKLYGDDGNDNLHGLWGDDQLYGGKGNDFLSGSDDDDQLDGGEGNDYLDGGAGHDTLTGGEGNDTLDGDAGPDRLTGGAGTDIFVFFRGESPSRLSAFYGDVINDFKVAGANRDALGLGFNIDFTRDLESQGLVLSHLIDADGDGATDDRQLTLPDGGIVALLNLGSAALVIDDFTFAAWDRDRSAFTIVDPEGDGDAGDEEEAQPETSLEQQLRLANLPVESGGTSDGGRARRQTELNEGELVNVDAGELDGLTLPEDAGGAYSSRYSLYWNPGDSGRFQLRFDDDATDALTPASTAAVIDAALEAMDSITAAEVTGAPGDWTLTITADAGHLLQAIDTAFDGDLQLDYMGA